MTNLSRSQDAAPPVKANSSRPHSGRRPGSFFYFDLGRYLSLEALKANRDKLLAFTEAHYATAVGLLFSCTSCRRRSLYPAALS